MHKLALGIDIGGTNTTFGVVNDRGDSVFEHTTSTRSHDTPEQLVDFIYQTLSKYTLLDQLCGIGIGVPNGNFYTGNMEYAPNVHWQGIVPFRSIFAEKFQTTVILTNDANAAAMGELQFGAAVGMQHFVLITIGTGIGSGIVENGRIVYGHNGMAGEYGHLCVVPNGRLCACGRRGCLEAYASCTGMVRSVQELDSQHKKTSVLSTIEHPNSKDIVEAYKHNDTFATEIIDFTVHMLGNALADCLCFSDPQAFILFGGYARADIPLTDMLLYHMNKAALKVYQNKADILISPLHDKNAAVLGAATLVFN